MIKKQLLLILLIGLFAISAFSQSIKAVKKEDNEVYTSVSQSAEYLGGMEKLYAYLSKHAILKSTDSIIFQRSKIIVSFIVEKDGSLTNFKVILSISADFDARYIRTLKSAGKWKPGYQEDRPIRQKYVIPCQFEPSEN